jgi:hypothetical protein
MVKIMISQHKIQWHIYRLPYFMQKLLQGRSFCNITGDKNGIWLAIMKRQKKGCSLLRPQKIQMDIRCPNHSHNVPTLAKNRGIRSMVHQF